MINYRSINDLNNAIVSGLSRLPRDLDLVVGIPRSGLIAANLIALHLNLPLTDLEGFLTGRLIDSGKRLKSKPDSTPNAEEGKALIVDDSVWTGSAMRDAKKRISLVNRPRELFFCAIYVSAEGRSEVDIFFEEILGERIFEWNVMHSKIMTQSCVDIDGVLCVDPTEEENDDGELYRQFLLNTAPLRIPSERIKSLVTCRLEKYRNYTEQWLKNKGVAYENLLMMDLPNKEARKAAGSHAEFKAAAYESTGSKLFIESDHKQAMEIAKIANRPVLCMDTQQMVYPSLLQYTAKNICKNPSAVLRRMKLFVNRFKRHLFDISPPDCL